LADADARTDKAALADECIHQLCGIVDDDGPDIERKAATSALAALLGSHDGLKGRIEAWLEDARAYGVYSSINGATVYECHCMRNLVLAIIALWDSDAAKKIAEDREIHWPDPELWPEGLPLTLADVFATLTGEGDEERVGALGQSWLDNGLLPASSATNLRPIFRMLLDFRKEPASKVEPLAIAGSLST